MPSAPLLTDLEPFRSRRIRSVLRTNSADLLGLYAFLAQIIPYADAELEMLFSSGRLLVRKLQWGAKPNGLIFRMRFPSSITGYKRISSGPIDLSGGESGAVKSQTDVGTGKATDIKAPLSAVITVDKIVTRYVCSSFRSGRRKAAAASMLSIM